jgi:hypothetical protein
MSDQATGNLTHNPSTNNPPIDNLANETLEERLRRNHADFLKEVAEWLGSIERMPATIGDDGMYEKFGKTAQKLIRLRSTAKTLHAAAKAPFLEAGRTVDTIFLTGVVKASETAQAVVENRQRIFMRAKEAAARKRAEDEAAAAAEASAAALRDAERAQDRGDTDSAMASLEQAAAADTAAEAATVQSEAKPADLVRTHSALGVTLSAKEEWVTTLVDRSKIDWAAIANNISDDTILKAAKAAVKNGTRAIAGFKIERDIKPINR